MGSGPPQLNLEFSAILPLAAEASSFLIYTSLTTVPKFGDFCNVHRSLVTRTVRGASAPSCKIAVFIDGTGLPCCLEEMRDDGEPHLVYPLRMDRRLRTDPDPAARGYSLPMCSKLWRRTEILERVLYTEAQSRLQLVCRAWRLLLTSPGFREDSASLALACHRPFLLSNNPEESAKADHPLRVDLSFIPAKFHKPPWWDKEMSHFRTEKTCTELPPLSLLPLSGLIRDVGKVVQEPGGLFFHITVLVECDDVSLQIARYSSGIGVWTMFRLRGAMVEPRQYMISGTLYEDNRVHILCVGPRATDPDKHYGLSSFSISNIQDGYGHCLATGFLSEGWISEEDFDIDHFVAHSHDIFVPQSRHIPC